MHVGTPRPALHQHPDPGLRLVPHQEQAGTRQEPHFAKADLDKIIGTFRAWKRGKGYTDVKTFCRSASRDEIAAQGYVLTPGRYVGAEDAKDDGEPFDRKMKRLVATLNEQFAEGAKLEKAIRKNLGALGYGP
jgi:type I restriction enzyme M protein